MKIFFSSLFIFMYCSFFFLHCYGEDIDYVKNFENFVFVKKVNEAEGGDSGAQFNLGLLYSIGQGVPQDYKEAARWYRGAAEGGDSGAQFNLGSLYDQGQGVPQDYKEAVRWYRDAAEQGHAGAQVNLGILHAKGLGVTEDYVSGPG